MSLDEALQVLLPFGGLADVFRVLPLGVELSLLGFVPSLLGVPRDGSGLFSSALRVDGARLLRVPRRLDLLNQTLKTPILV